MFIHTFAMKKNITEQELHRLFEIYKDIDGKSRIITLQNEYYENEVTAYCNSGIRIMLRHRTEKEWRYDPEHHPVDMTLIVTPYKLLHPAEPMGQLNDEEFIHAIQHLTYMFHEIKNQTGIDLTDLKIDRIDITKDVTTPNREYSAEILTIQQSFPLPRGYVRHHPTDMQIQSGWNKEFSYQFYNKNKGLFYKVYDKAFELKERDIQCPAPDETGLLRYEISIMRKCLINHYPNQKDDSFALLLKANHEKDVLMHHFYDLPFTCSGLVSCHVMKKLMGKNLGGKKKTASDMLKLAKTFRHYVDNHIEPDISNMDISFKKYNRLIEKFLDMDTAPIPLEADFPYIPSIHEQLDDAYNWRMMKFAKKNTRKKVYWDGHSQDSNHIYV